MTTTIKVSKEAVDSVVDSIQVAAERLTHTAVVMQQSGMGTAALSLLTGHGLPTVLFAQVELLCARALSESARLGETAEVARANGDTLLGADVAPTRSVQWVDLFHGGTNLGFNLVKSGPGLAQAFSYAGKGTLSSHAARWQRFGSMNAGFFGVGSGLASVAGSLIGDNAVGRFVSAGGGVASSAFQFGQVARYAGSSQFLRIMGTRAAAKVLAPVGLVVAGINIFDLATTGYDDLVYGDKEGHSDNVRAALYTSKVVDTIGIVAVSGATIAAAVAVAASAPVSVPVIGAIMLGGLALSGASALINGTVAAQDYNRENPEVLRQVLRTVTSTTRPDWPQFHVPGLKELLR